MLQKCSLSFLFLLDSYPCFPIHKTTPIPLHPFSAAILHWFTHYPVLFCVAYSDMIQMDTAGTVPLKVQYLSTKLHDITSKENVIFIFTILRTWNVTNPHYIYLEIKSRLNQGNYCYCRIQKHFGNCFSSYIYIYIYIYMKHFSTSVTMKHFLHYHYTISLGTAVLSLYSLLIMLVYWQIVLTVNLFWHVKGPCLEHVVVAEECLLYWTSLNTLPVLSYVAFCYNLLLVLL